MRLEQQLEAYQKLHQDELAELWQALSECKRAVIDLLDHQTPESETPQVTPEKYRDSQPEKGGQAKP